MVRLLKSYLLPILKYVYIAVQCIPLMAGLVAMVVSVTLVLTTLVVDCGIVVVGNRVVDARP